MDRLSILVSSYNRPDLIGHSIDSILMSKVPDDLEIEIIIVDDQSNEETWKVLNNYRNYSNIIIYRNPTKTGSGGPNWSKGFQLSTGNIIINNEDDMIWHPEYINILYNELKKNDEYTCLFGLYIQCDSIEDIRPPETKPVDPHPQFGLFTKIPYKPTDNRKEHISHNQFFCYKEFFEGLDELWHHYPGTGLREETDLYLRTLRLTPKRKYKAVPDAYLWHVHNKSGKNILTKKKLRNIDSKNHIIFIKRNFGMMAYFHIAAYKVYLAQKSIRDWIGYHLVDKWKKD